jgi:hypothetical protein
MPTFYAILRSEQKMGAPRSNVLYALEVGRDCRSAIRHVHLCVKIEKVEGPKQIYRATFHPGIVHIFTKVSIIISLLCQTGLNTEAASWK